MTETVPELFSDGFMADPSPTYNHLRETDPVVRIDYPGHRLSVWYISRYEDVRAAFVDPRFCKDRTQLGSDCPLASTAHHDPELVALTRCLNMVDDPEHTRLRRLVSGGFTPRRVKQMEAEARSYANKLLAEVVADGKADLVSALANPLSFDIIGGMIGGLPNEEGRGFDRVRLRELGQRLTTPVNGTTPLEYNEIKREIKRLTLDLIERRRGSQDGDSFSAFIEANENGQITDDELLAMVVTLVVGGMDTTASFIATAFHSLLTNPDQLQLLKENPELMESAVEELLRYAGGMQTASFHYTKADVEIGGVTIPRGEVVAFVLYGANRDPRQFADPDKLDINRADNPHLGFGLGMHNCLGQKLGRMLTMVAIETVLDRLKDIQLAVPGDQVRWRPGALLRAPHELPVVFTAGE